MKTSLILTCAGKGERAGFGKNKLLVEMQNGKTVLEQTLFAFIDSGKIDEYIVTASAEDFEQIKTLLPEFCKIVLGGGTRTASVKNALKAVSGDVVLIHDGARPYVTNNLIADCVNTANEKGGCVPALPCRDTVMESGGDVAGKYLGKSGLYAVQTPQAFKTELIIDAYARAGEKTFNDDGEVYQRYIGDLYLVDGDVNNIKLTFRQDFDGLAQVRFGTGFDCHKLVENRKLILGGILIPHEKGLLGHSDADVLTHAIMDAILSALALRDIGYHFPDNDNAFKDADSIELLKKVLELIKDKGYKVQSISASIMAEKPKLKGHIPAITDKLSNVLGLSPEMVGISATTLEGLGFVGREEGICTHATATLIRI